MAYAIKIDGSGWRSVNGESDLIGGEIFSESIPPAEAAPASYMLSQELLYLSDQYKKDLEQYRLLWISISITDGVNEDTRKNNLRAKWVARATQYSSDIAATKLKYQ